MANSDFNGDGRDDILWRNDDGTVGNWLGQLGGGFAYNAAAGLTPTSTSWHIVATGDYNGDGFADVLWRHDTGSFGTWLGDANGRLTYNAAAGLTAVGQEWQIAGTGDFDGDGRDDLLWTNGAGQVGNWLANGNGGFAYNGAAGLSQQGTDWNVIAIGDFNMDGRDDILWRDNDGAFSTWAGQVGGALAYNMAAGIVPVPVEWTIVGTGDFNGDGRDDILWRNFYDGRIGNWLAQPDGSFAYNDAAGLTPMGLDWHVAGVGDYDGDGFADILWETGGGMIGQWRGQTGGRFVANDAVSYSVPVDWSIEPVNPWDNSNPGPWDY
jgi:hypothetical protein